MMSAREAFNDYAAGLIEDLGGEAGMAGGATVGGHLGKPWGPIGIGIGTVVGGGVGYVVADGASTPVADVFDPNQSRLDYDGDGIPDNVDPTPAGNGAPGVQNPGTANPWSGWGESANNNTEPTPVQFPDGTVGGTPLPPSTSFSPGGGGGGGGGGLSFGVGGAVPNTGQVMVMNMTVAGYTAAIRTWVDADDRMTGTHAGAFLNDVLGEYMAPIQLTVYGSQVTSHSFGPVASRSADVPLRACYGTLTRFLHDAVGRVTNDVEAYQFIRAFQTVGGGRMTAPKPPAKRTYVKKKTRSTTRRR
jgi:hypothetical protein